MRVEEEVGSGPMRATAMLMALMAVILLMACATPEQALPGARPAAVILEPVTGSPRAKVSPPRDRRVLAEARLDRNSVHERSRPAERFPLPAGWSLAWVRGGR